MASANSFTWGSLLTPVNKLMSDYGIDPHLGIDVLVTFLVITILAYFGGRKFRSSNMVEPNGKLDFAGFF